MAADDACYAVLHAVVIRVFYGHDNKIKSDYCM